MAKCEHTGAVTLYEKNGFAVEVCEWGCGSYLITRKMAQRPGYSFTRLATKEECLLIQWAMDVEAVGVEVTGLVHALAGV